MNKEPVVILCGGKGTRLRGDIEPKPKALVEIGGIPIICHIMSHYAKYGYANFILALGHMGNKIKEYFVDLREMKGDFTLQFGTQDKLFYQTLPDWNITFVDTGQETPTGGRLKAVEKYISTNYFLATYCDGLSNVDIGKLLKTHFSYGRMATLTAVCPSSPFGVLDIRGNLVYSFKEKPRLDGRINGGYFVFDRELLKFLRPNSILEEGVLRRLTEQDQLAAYKHDGFWECMDTFKQVESLNRLYDESQGKPPWEQVEV